MARASRHSRPMSRCMRENRRGRQIERRRRQARRSTPTGASSRPGFIDHHTHFDPQAVWDPYCGSWVHNGHTTVIVGQCGQVIAPVRPGDGEWYLEFFSDAEQIPLPVLKAGVDVTWESVGDYLNALGKKRGINVGTLGRPFRHPPLCDGRGRRPTRQGHRGRNGGDAAADPRGDV